MTDKETIQSRWDSFRSLQFPRNCADLDPNGVCLASTDTYAARCITSYLSSGLPKSKREVLQNCSDDLHRALDDDTIAEDVRLYFTELRAIAIEVLSATE